MQWRTLGLPDNWVLGLQKIIREIESVMPDLNSMDHNNHQIEKRRADVFIFFFF